MRYDTQIYQWTQITQSNLVKRNFSALFDDERRFATIKLLLDRYRESWHAIKKLFNLTLKVRYPAIT